jgi:hypothetical protein
MSGENRDNGAYSLTASPTAEVLLTFMFVMIFLGATAMRPVGAREIVADAPTPSHWFYGRSVEQRNPRCHGLPEAISGVYVCCGSAT